MKILPIASLLHKQEQLIKQHGSSPIFFKVDIQLNRDACTTKKVTDQSWDSYQGA